MFDRGRVLVKTLGLMTPKKIKHVDVKFFGKSAIKEGKKCRVKEKCRFRNVHKLSFRFNHSFIIYLAKKK